MDDPTLSYGPARGWAWAFLGIAALAAVGAVVADVEGRVLAIAVAVAFAGLAVADHRASPRVEVDGAGLIVRSAAGARQLAWDDLESVTVDERIRFGRIVHALEIDAGEHLIVLGPRTLGADPVTAARRIVAAAPPELRAALGGDIRHRAR